MKYLVLFIVLLLLGTVFFLNVDCVTCKGVGTIDELKKVQVSCQVCKGNGKRSAGLASGLKGGGTTKKLGGSVRVQKCLKCQGSGTLEKMVPVGACPTCNETGEIKLSKKLLGAFKS
jgi:DnaJ-class molecular chaperone